MVGLVFDQFNTLALAKTSARGLARQQTELLGRLHDAEQARQELHAQMGAAVMIDPTCAIGRGNIDLDMFDAASRSTTRSPHGADSCISWMMGQTRILGYIHNSNQTISCRKIIVCIRTSCLGESSGWKRFRFPW